MKIMTVLGSPRKLGNSAKILEWAEEELRALGHDVERLDLVDHPFKGCAECYHCKEDPLTAHCAHTDEGNEIFLRLIGCDGFIVASPLFCWGFSSQLKAFIDRMFCLVTPMVGKNHSLIEGKRAAMIITCAGPEEDNADIMHTVFQRAMNYVQCENKAALIVPGCITPDTMGGDIKEKAQELARKLVR
jgi:multimeric flavodoxin WrbA